MYPITADLLNWICQVFKTRKLEQEVVFPDKLALPLAQVIAVQGLKGIQVTSITTLLCFFNVFKSNTKDHIKSFPFTCFEYLTVVCLVNFIISPIIISYLCGLSHSVGEKFAL